MFPACVESCAKVAMVSVVPLPSTTSDSRAMSGPQKGITQARRAARVGSESHCSKTTCLDVHLTAKVHNYIHLNSQA